MKPEFPKIDRDKMASPHAQEVEYALILSRMITTVKEDPSQLRHTVYEFARARLKIDTSWADGAERKRLSAALETAIRGVEEFSARRDEIDRLQPPSPPAQQIATNTAAAEPSSKSVVSISRVDSAPKSNLAPKEYYLRHEAKAEPVIEVRSRTILSTLARVSFGILLFGVVTGLAAYKERPALFQPYLKLLPSSIASKAAQPATTAPAIPNSSQRTPAAPEAKTAAVSADSLPFPLPTDYGVYALSDAKLSELHLLPEQIPDKRVSISTPINQPISTVLPDGKAKFVVFRRDLAGTTPDRIEVRVVARVARALRFDAKGKPTFSPVSDTWNIRNLSYEFRVRPIAGNPEMLLVQPQNADFTLPAGRYALALRDQGYDFTIAGKITDPWQCLERTDAANGTFYSDCQKQ
jgi:hypothetical protein